MPTVISQIILNCLPVSDPLCMIDGGALGGTEAQKWGFLGKRLRLDGFEPDAQECERLNAQSRATGESRHYHAICLGREEGNHVLYVPQRADCSSFYKPAQQRVARWKQCTDGRNCFRTGDYFTLAKTLQVKTTTLDRWVDSSQIACVDYVKLDVQGAELDILQGATETLGQVLAIEAEVEFVPIYENQPLFADLDAFVRAHGFSFFNFHYSHAGHFGGRVASPVNVVYPQSSFLLPQAAGQLITADAFYMIDPLDPLWPASRKLTLSKYLKLIVIAEVGNQIEFAFELLAALRDGSAPVSEAYNQANFGAILQQASQQYMNPPR